MPNTTQLVKRLLTDRERLSDVVKHWVQVDNLNCLRAYLEQCSQNEVLNPSVPHFSTPLQYAAEGGSAEAVGQLLSHGASVNLKGEDGNDPLGAAIEAGRPAIVRLLIAHGAKVHNRDGADWTRLMNTAFWSGESRLNSCEGNPSDPACPEYLEIARILLAAGADVNETSDDGRTALTTAVEHSASDERLIRIFVVAGADVTAKNARGESALSLALMRRHRGIAEALRGAGGGRLGVSDGHVGKEFESSGEQH